MPCSSQLVRALCRTASPVLAAGLVLCPGAAAAQGFEAVGTRARGMAGAFVAVADDATATYWNPAGLPATLFADAVIDFGTVELIPDAERPIQWEAGAGRARATGTAVAVPVVGFSYYRLRTSVAGQPATAGVAPGRQDPQAPGLARSLVSHHVGVTLVQSVGDAVVIGGTARLVRGRLAVDRHPSSGVEQALDDVAALDGPGKTTGDVDLGVMVRVGRVRLGLAARNLASPTFRTSDGDAFDVDRAVRVGLAVGAEAGRGRQPWVVAVDADLTRAEAPGGPRRMVAVGAERWLAGRRLGVRGGLRASTLGAARPAGSVGGSVAVRTGVAIEAEVTRGGDAADRGWGLGLHVSF